MMTTGRTGFRRVALAVALVSAACSSAAEPEEPPLFSEYFEGGLGQWTGRVTGHHAQIVPDPLNSGNSVVNFTRTVAAGDLFSVALALDVDVAYTLTFDYLGLPQAGSLPNNLGGFLGISDEIPGDHFWLYGPAANTAEHLRDLIEDGSWHSYSVTFTPSALITTTGGDFRIMIEDGEGAGSLPGDAYFDNIELRNAN